MNVQAVGSFTPDLAPVADATPTTSASPPPSPHLIGALDGIAQQLSMSSTDLRSALGSGTSVTDLAARKGVSRSDLLQSVADGIQQRRAAHGKPPLDQSLLDSIVSNGFDRRRGGAPATASADGSGSVDLLA